MARSCSLRGRSYPFGYGYGQAVVSSTEVTNSRALLRCDKCVDSGISDSPVLRDMCMCANSEGIDSITDSHVSSDISVGIVNGGILLSYKNEVKRVRVDSGVAESCVSSDINTVQRACANTESLVSSKVEEHVLIVVLLTFSDQRLYPSIMSTVLIMALLSHLID